MTDTEARLAAIRERRERTTKGEWFADGEPHNVIVWSDENHRVCFMTSNGKPEANADFITEAHNADIPWLLDREAKLSALAREGAAIVREAAGKLDVIMRDDLYSGEFGPRHIVTRLKAMAEKMEGGT